MIETSNAGLIRSFRRFAAYTSVFIFGVGLSVFIGWMFDSAILKRVLPQFNPMAPNTAACFMLLGICLFALRDSSERAWQSALVNGGAGIVAGIGLVTLFEYATGLDFAIDRLLFSSSLAADFPLSPGRMSPNSALCFLLAGSSLLCLDRQMRVGCRPAQLLIMLEGLIALLALVGYAYGTPTLYSVSFYKPMALHTAVAFMLVCVAVLCVRPSCGLMEVVTSNSEGGIMVRRLLVVIIAVPLVLGWLIMSGEQAHAYNIAFGLSLFAVLIVVVFSILIWSNASLLHNIDILRLRMEQEIEQQKDLSIRLIQSSTAPTFVLDPSHTCIIWNRALEELTGTKAIDMIGTRDHWKAFYAHTRPTLADVIIDGSFEQLPRLYGEFTPSVSLAEGWHGEGWFENLGGKKRYILFDAAPIYNNKNVLIASIETLQDITDRKHVEQLKSDFVSMVSHQLKTPVAQLKGYLYNMLAGITGELGAKQRLYLEEMLEISSRNYRLISDLLNISRIERGVLAVDIKPVGLQEVVDAALADYYDVIKQRNLTLVLEGLENDIRVLADKDKLVEAIGNVVNNALKFMQAGTLTVKARSENGFGLVEIEDTGSGMSPDVMEKLFRKDQALTGAPKSGGGAGIGLYIAKQFLLLQKGDIGVASEPGKGSRFIFRVPLNGF